MNREEFKKNIGRFRSQNQKLINDTYLWSELVLLYNLWILADILIWLAIFGVVKENRQMEESVIAMKARNTWFSFGG